MAEHGSLATKKGDQQVLITRMFDAPRALVFKAWSDPKMLARWFAPNDCMIEIRSMDFRVGGSFQTCIRNPKFGDCWCKGVYREIAAPERIVYSIALCDEAGNFIDSLPAGKDPDWPSETIVTVTLAEQNGKTKLTLHQNVSELVAKRTGAYPSWLQMLDKLTVELAK